jgi:hypothetical protein
VSRKLPIIFSILTALLVYSCRRNVHLPETVEAHYIKYNIEYMEATAGDIPTRILPSIMHSWYTDHYVLTKIEGFFNQFSLIQIADLKHKRVTTLLNFFGNKVYYRSGQGELPASIVAPEHLSYTNTGESSVIGGLHSRRLEVDTGEERFSIYYTDDFSVRRPNLSTPYRSINKPLSEFQIQLSYLKMHLSCSLYESRMVESEIFIIPDEYRAVTRPVMEDIINSLFTKD